MMDAVFVPSLLMMNDYDDRNEAPHLSMKKQKKEEFQTFFQKNVENPIV